jgi:phage anti-repressor protein
MNNLSVDLVKAFITSEVRFSVDFEEAWKWCGYSTKASALRKIKSIFIKCEDYEIFNNIVEKSGGRPTEAYFLTADCFKELAMLAQTEKGKQVRLYFLECEKILKESQEPQKILSPAELALLQAQNILNLEKKVNSFELKLSSIEQKQINAEKELDNLEESNLLPFNKPTRAKIRQRILTYCKATGIDVRTAYNSLSGVLIQIPDRLKNQGKK